MQLQVPAMSACPLLRDVYKRQAQEDYESLKRLMRDGVSIVSYLIVPIALGLFCIAPELSLIHI